MAIKDATWRGRFETELSDQEIDAAVTVAVPALSELSKLQANDAANKLESKLKEIFVPSKQVREILRMLQSLSRTYCSLRYHDAVSFLRNVYAADAEHDAYEPDLAMNCLLGLPGVGKSAVIRAYSRLFQSIPLDIPSHGSYLLRSNWRMTVKASAGLRQLVAPHFRTAEALRSRHILFPAIQREICAQGVPLLLADELQFLTQGQGNTLPAKLLNQLARLGPPVVFAANYSLIHRLSSRPSEEKQRLLTKPYFLHPDPVGSDDWKAFIKGVLSIADEFSSLQLDSIQATLHSYTFGMRRLVVTLLVQAYVRMRNRLGSQVSSSDFDEAYCSSAFAGCRVDVEILTADLAKSSNRKDLWCPLPGSDLTKRSAQGKVVVHPSVPESQRRSVEASLLASMTPREREAAGVRTIDEVLAKTVKKRSRPSPNGKELLEGAAAFRQKKRQEETDSV